MSDDTVRLVPFDGDVPDFRRLVDTLAQQVRESFLLRPDLLPGAKDVTPPGCPFRVVTTPVVPPGRMLMVSGRDAVVLRTEGTP